MENFYEEYFISEDPREIEKEKGIRGALHSILPQLMEGTEDKTNYILLKKEKTDNNVNLDNRQISNKSTFGISKNVLNFGKNNDMFESVQKSSNANESPKLNKVNFNEIPQPSKEKKNSPIYKNPLNVFNYKDSLKRFSNFRQSRLKNNDSIFDVESRKNKLDSLWYDNGHLNVTFRNDIIDSDGFSPFRNNDRQGCKRRCIEMLQASGGELSGERIDMTINNGNGRPIASSYNFKQGIDAINSSLDKGKPIILNVDYKEGNASSADKAGDHFIIVVGKTVIDNLTYYHFYDPATSDVKRGTASRNVLYVKDGYLLGNFLKYDGTVNKYKVTSVRRNK